MSTTSLYFHPELFEDRLRERDRIIWRVSSGVLVYPIYRVRNSGYIISQGDTPAPDTALVLQAPGHIIHRDYYCHDQNLHDFRPFAGREAMFDLYVFDQLRDIGILPHEYMVYELPVTRNDGQGWVAGFASHYQNFIADAVDMLDDIEDMVDTGLDTKSSTDYVYRKHMDSRLDQLLRM